MNTSPIISQTKLDALLERICRKIDYLSIPVDSATPLWDGPLKMCQQIENDPFAADSVILETKKKNRHFNGVNTPRLYHAILCRVYILLYYLHHGEKLYEEIAFPRLKENMGVYNDVHLNVINERIDKILAQEELMKKVKEEKKRDVKPVFAYVPHNGNQQDHLYIEYSEEQLFRMMTRIINALIADYGTYQDEANVWYNAKKLVHTLRDLNHPELLIERAAVALVSGQRHNGYEGAQIILLCAYAMIRSSKNNAHFDPFIHAMEKLAKADTDMVVIRGFIDYLKKWISESQPFDGYDYIGEQASNSDTYTSADIERIRKQIAEHEMAEREKLLKRIDELVASEKDLKQQVSSLKKELDTEKAKKKAEPTEEEEEEVEMLSQVESVPILKLLWYLMKLDGAKSEGQGRKKAARNILSTLSKIPFETTKHVWKNEEKPITRQRELLNNMNVWLEIIGMKFRF